jgi:biopolymer transport protein ExbB
MEILRIGLPDSGRIPAMRRCKTSNRVFDLATRGLVVAIAVSFAIGANDPDRIDPNLDHARHDLHSQADLAERAASLVDGVLEFAIAQVRSIGGRLTTWYRRTPPADRVICGGMTACAGLGLVVLWERLVRLRRRTIVPPEFTARFLDRLHEGKLDCGQALDYCELNPSPAARVALAAVRRWGRPPADLERAVALAHRVESERLRRNVGTLRRIAVLTPLLGLLGALYGMGRALEGISTVSPSELNPPTSASAPAISAAPSMMWGPALAGALTPLSAGIIIATLALVAYDGLLIRIEKLTGSLDRLGAETIDAIALIAPVSSPAFTLSHVPARSLVSMPNPVLGAPSTAARTPHGSSIRRGDRSDSTIRSSDQEIGF